MSRSSNAAEERLDLIFRALADRTRRSLLVRLRDQPATVGELAAPYDMSLPAVSKHLRVLERAGLLERQVDGRVHHCSLNPDALQEVDRWLAFYRVFWTDTLGALAQYAEADQ